METVTANIKGKVRRERLYGRKFLVAPLTMIVPGVLAGSQGPLYYPTENVKRNPDDWNGMPIVAYHPSTPDGKPISARQPDVLNKQGIGFVFGSVFNSTLSAEGWFDEELTRRVDKRILQSLEAGKPVELSTGLHTEVEQAPAGATHNNLPYTHIVRSMRPDHLAILPDQKGACSLKDGCGVLVNTVCEACKRKPIANDASMGCCPECGAAGQSSEGGNDTCANGHTYPSDKALPSKSTSNASLSGVKPMKDQLIQWLTANCSCWKGANDSETLNAMSEEKLKQLKDTAEQTANTATLVTNLRTELEAAKAVVVPAPVVPTAPRLTPDEVETLNWANAERQRQKALLVDRLLVNVSDPAVRNAKGQKLMAKPTAELQDLIELLPAQGSTPTANFDFSRPLAPNYAGAAGGPAYNAVQDDDPNDFPPTINIEYPDPRTRRQA